MIKKSRVRSLKPYLRLIPGKENVYAGVVNPSEAKLKRIGFSDTLDNGETVLPHPVGSVSMYNAEGKIIVHKDQPMETAYRTVDWHWTEWHGHDKVEQSDFRDVPYKRYPRTEVAPPSLQLTLFTDTNGQRVVLTPLIIGWRKNDSELIHAVNLLLEIFGESTFFDEKKEQVVTAPVRQLNWKILPQGEHPFAVLRKHLKEALGRVKEGNRSFVDHRLERVNGYRPEFTAVGHGGFTGYVIFGFPKKGIYVLESILYGNATYVLGEDWEKISQMTKAQILNNDLHRQRIVHLRNWFEKIRQLLGD
ncbi:MAG TPA: hypothetical protein VLF91_02240 [Candidatus Saccharimonadales bacterium]|nr:hypothetical protein [Candidatus Saccharimonadales bacterium]